MQLSKIERALLVNQFKILEALDTDAAEDFAAHRVALECGYSLHYADALANIENELSEADCLFVIDVLKMYQDLTISNSRLGATALPLAKIQFPGFDGNEESQLMAYARYFVLSLDRFVQLQTAGPATNFNSHCRTVDRYQRMLEAFEKFSASARIKLSSEELESILAA